MIVCGTPLEDYPNEGLLVKREDLSCPPPGPPFSKTRGVLAHVRARYAEGYRLFGVLDTSHSQAGHAVAMACREVGAQCWNYFPVYARDLNNPKSPYQVRITDGSQVSLRDPQIRSSGLGAQLHGLPAGRSAILFHRARKEVLAEPSGYMMPNALKLPETVAETCLEVTRTFEMADRTQRAWLLTMPWLISASSGTIAAGVLAGLYASGARGNQVLIHLGYSRSEAAVRDYLRKETGGPIDQLYDVRVIDEGYAYADQAWPSSTRNGVWEHPAWPCNPYYDLKAYRWWSLEGRHRYGSAVLWNIG